MPSNRKVGSNVFLTWFVATAAWSIITYEKNKRRALGWNASYG
jgi:hypothetical protein